MAKAKEAKKKDAPKAGLLSALPGLFGSLGTGVASVLQPFIPLLLLGTLYALAAIFLWRPVQNDAQAVLTREKLAQPFTNNQERPNWITPAQFREIGRLGVEAGEGRSVFEPGLAADLAHAYSSSPWIERSGMVHVRYPATVALEKPQFRAPFARLDNDSGGAVLDRQGVLLPLDRQFLNSAPTSGMLGGNRTQNNPVLDLPVISGVRPKRSPDGLKVQDNDTRDGLELLATVNAVLTKAPGGRPAARVQREPSGTWRVVLAQGGVVEWGYWSDEQRPQDEPASRDKIAALARRLSECGPQRLRMLKLDQPNFPVALD